MRPIHLQIAGLQSYREAQDIDFSALTGAGVFGIFGPTGSGKSTLLDAMTLALFGKVERAPGGTQAIMNQAEQTLSVSFTFELGHALGVKRYRVDRQFKRGGDVSVLGSLCRLIQYRDDEAIVLADKAGEVNQQIQDILGLSMADFTRAVVLPQGKFAEFLTLTGKDRRAMLQRLFHLEPYGDRLSAKTAARFKETDVAIRALQAEQQGLGDASQAALALAEQRLGEAREAARGLRERLAACERRAAELRAVRELQRERASLAARQAALAAQAPRVAQLAARLARAAQAERLRPLVRRRSAAEAQLAQQRGVARAAAEALGAAQGALAAAQAAHAAAREALAAQEAPLAARLEQLRQAAQLAAELAAARERLAALAAEGGRREAQLAALRAEQTRERELREKALQRQAQLRDELKRAEVPAAHRERLQEALQEKRELERLAKLEAEQQAETNRLQAELQRLSQAETSLHATQREWEQLAAEWSQELLAAYQASREAESRLTGLESRIAEEIARRRKAQQQAELSAMAEALAAHLHQGEACPVCGSVAHPNPALPQAVGALAGNLAAPQDEAVMLERQQNEARESRFAVQGHLQSLQALERQWRQAVEEESQGLPVALGEAAVTAVSATESSAPGIPGERIAETLRETAESAAGVSRRIQRLQAKLQELLQSKRQLDKQRHDGEARKQTAQTLFDTHAAKAGETREALNAVRSGWQAKFPELRADELDELAERLKRQDQLAEELRGRLDKSVEFLDEKRSRMEQLQQELGETEKEFVRLTTERQALEQQTGQQAERLRAWVGDEDASALAAKAQAELHKLRTEAQRSAQLLEDAQARQQAEAKAEAAARQAVESARLAYEEAEAEWAQQASAEGFATADEVAQALVPPEQQQAWAAEVEAHGKQEHQLAARQTELDAELAGRQVTEEEWTALEEELARCKAEDEAALQATAKAERDHEELQAKHARWSELEAEREKSQQELSLLGKLQSVLRGNTFVEFLAEEQLMHVSRAASERLGQLTRQKYAIEVDSGGGFVIRDNANGGVRRPVTTLSGGETFLTSLSLSLALSTQIQLKGEHPLEFFFLDEGFGTLDQELLDTVITALEKLHLDKLTVGVISHVPELRARLPRRLVVHPAEPNGRGSRVTLETM
ncbi:AAA family ATPase [Paenibacillus elgii]|uniref:AAA family ATPase n=3 Tax=Paenibacillus elgii TaxID=189691 RepID=UPI0024150EBE|nr:SMC family ATPase [Paenibacillus elgii]